MKMLTELIYVESQMKIFNPNSLSYPPQVLKYLKFEFLPLMKAKLRDDMRSKVELKYQRNHTPHSDCCHIRDDETCRLISIK